MTDLQGAPPAIEAALTISLIRPIAGWRFALHETLPSTQDVALQAARTGAPGRLAVLAHTPTQGRGSRGRDWSAPAGNLNLSLLLRPATPTTPAIWPLLAGLALHDAIAPHLPHKADLMLKWPNDLLLNGAKLGGILIDSAMAPDGRLEWVVIGLGLNIQSAPPIPGRRTACLAEAGAAPAPKSLAENIAAQIDRWLLADFPAIRAAWLARAHKVGTPIHLTHQGREHIGEFAGLSPDGALLLAGHPNPIIVGETMLASCFSS